MANTKTAIDKKPNFFELSGDGIQVTYSTTSFEGQPHFNYHDATLSKLFVGNQIRTENTALGTLVSVTIHQTIDAGSTSFTILIPRVNLRVSNSAPIVTYGITTLHKFSIVGAPNGQADIYTAHSMQGIAAEVFF
jgi:hypothetical protein